MEIPLGIFVENKNYLVNARSDDGVSGDFRDVRRNCEVYNKEKEALFKMNDGIIGETYFLIGKKDLKTDEIHF